MSTQRQIPGGPYVNETATRQAQVPGGAFVNETVSAAAGSVGASDGVAAVSGVGSSTAASPGTSAGIAAVSGVGASTTAGVGASDGIAAVSGTGAATASATGASDGIAVVTGISPSTVEATGSATGVATVIGISPAISVESASNWQDTPKNFLWSRKELEPDEAEIIEALAETQAKDLESTEAERKEQLRKALKLKNIEIELRHIEAINSLRGQVINAEIASLMKIAQIEAENEEYLELLMLAAA